MAMNKLHKRSLELIDKFIAETPPDELAKFIDKFDKLDIQGPTIAEYLNEFNSQYEILNWNCESVHSIQFGFEETESYEIKDILNRWYDPPQRKFSTPKSRKKMTLKNNGVIFF